MPYDPITGLPIDPTRPKPAVNTRIFLYHRTREPIVVEGKGKNDAERLADVQEQIKAKIKQGFRLERFDGQHPHSFDDHRMEHQTLTAADTTLDAATRKAAQDKLDAKAKR